MLMRLSPCATWRRPNYPQGGGGCIVVQEGAVLTTIGTTFTQCSCLDSGGAVLLEGSFLIVSNGRGLLGSGLNSLEVSSFGRGGLWGFVVPRTVNVR